jgi:UDP-GlcNAc:undecaprenyl-phosphate GlcNAc-1-phosphate transferase
LRTYIYVYIFVSAFVISWLLVPLFKRIATRRQLFDRPGERKIHAHAKPLLGGLAIYISFIAVILMNVVGLLVFRSNVTFAKFLPAMVLQWPRLVMILPHLIAILAGGTLVMVIGLIDDIKGVQFSYKLKFYAQVGAALILVMGGVKTRLMPNDFLNYLVTILWVVGITNAFNFLDSMDGLSAGVAGIASLIFFAVTSQQGQFFSALILIAFAGSVLGFLRYNFYPSKIFMGDAGSLFLGFILGSLTITSSYVVRKSTSLIPVVMPILILSIPLFDTFSVIYIRLKEKRPIYVGDQRHFSHRLVDLGMSQRGAAIFIYLVSFCVGVTATLLPYVSLWGSVVILLQAIIIYCLITVLMIVGMRQAKKGLNSSKM